MTDNTTESAGAAPGSEDEEREAFVRWVREQHGMMARYAAGRGLIGEDAEGVPVWSIPHQIFVGRFYDKSAREGGYWYIAGALPSDHIPANVAATPRDAVRHFALKWQLQAAQIEEGGQSDEERLVDFANAAENLTKSAEALFALVETDSLWDGATAGPAATPNA